MEYISDEDGVEQERVPPNVTRTPAQVAQPLFPSTLCSGFVDVIKMLDDHAVSSDGTAVYEVAYQAFDFIYL